MLVLVLKHSHVIVNELSSPKIELKNTRIHNTNNGAVNVDGHQITRKINIFQCANLHSDARYRPNN